MDNNKNTFPTTKQLAELFTSLTNVEIIPWEDNSEAIGLSILKDYPDKGLFIPIRTSKGDKDSVAMIRVWCMIKDLAEIKDSKKVRLNIGIIKSSRYLFKHHFYDFAAEDSPTETILAASKASKQPIDLEEYSRYELHIKTFKIYDLKKKKYVKPEEIVEEIYRAHLNTLTNFTFQMKMLLQRMIVESIDPINNFLKKTNLYLFGKHIKTNKDFTAGIITPYSFQDLDDVTPLLEKTKILGSNFPISHQAATTFVTFFSIIFILNYSSHYDFLGIVRFIDSISNNFFLAVITIGMLLLFDKVIPYFIFFSINLLIRFKWYLMTKKIKL